MYRKGDGTGTVEKWCRGAAVLTRHRATLSLICKGHRASLRLYALYNEQRQNSEQAADL